MLLIIIYSTVLFVTKNNLFTQQFDKTLIRKYFLSQDIPHEVAEKRVFLSDAQIYEATGYLYSHGYNPAQYNFEHPPFIKYLFGFSIKFFGSFFPAQLAFGLMTIVLSYVIFYNVARHHQIAFFSTLLLQLDPLFIDVSSTALLDMGQTACMLLYFYAVFFRRKNYLLQGVALGLFAGCKFWITPIFFIAIFSFYFILRREFDKEIFVKHIVVAFIVYNLLYFQTYIVTNGEFNIFWHMLKTLKYRFMHNSNSFFGASFVLYLTGYIKEWWGESRRFVRTEPWWPLWPVMFAVNVMQGIVYIKNRLYTVFTVVLLAPICYLLYISTQIPFPRYFLVTLPFFYFSFVYSLYRTEKTT